MKGEEAKKLWARVSLNEREGDSHREKVRVGVRTCIWLHVHVCVCVRERESEGERERSLERFTNIKNFGSGSSNSHFNIFFVFFQHFRQSLSITP